MNPNLGEITPEARLEVGSRRCIERLASRVEHFMNDGGRLADGGLRLGRLFLKFFLLLAGVAFAAELGPRGRDGGSRVGDAHHLVRDAIRLVLERIIHLSDYELCLYGAWALG
jgi:hypothetical protein